MTEPRRPRSRTATAVIVLAGVLGLLVVAGLAGFDPIGSVRNRLFGTRDRASTAGVTLMAIRETAELRAATGRFSVPVYVGTEQDGLVREVLPDALDANSAIAIYEGSVDALVDLGGLTEGDLEVDRDGRRVVVELPPATLSEPNIDEERSKVVAQDRGLLTRLGELFGSRPLEGREELDRAAVAALGDAAAESDLRGVAQANATQYLERLLGGLGYDEVVVRFREPRP